MHKRSSKGYKLNAVPQGIAGSTRCMAAKNQRARRPDPKAQVRIPQARRTSADSQKRNVRVTSKGRLTNFGGSQMTAPRLI